MAATNQADIVWTIANDITFRTEDSVLQRNGIQNPSSFPRTDDTRTVHHSTSQKPEVILPVWRSISSLCINPVTACSRAVCVTIGAPNAPSILLMIRSAHCTADP